MNRALLILFSLSFLLQGCGANKAVIPPSMQEIAIPLPEARAPCPPAKELNKSIIIIDAGHGGEDFGAHSNSRPHYQEKHLNLATARLLKTYLAQQGYKTIMTRSDDCFIGLDERAQFANEKKPTLFVSVHYNSAPSKEAHGIEVYFYRSEQDKKRTKESRLLAECVLDSVLDHTKAKSRGVKHGDFAVIRETKMPAILIEGGFLTNDQEMQRIKDPAYLKKLAWGIAQGIHSYLDQ